MGQTQTETSATQTEQTAQTQTAANQPTTQTAQTPEPVPYERFKEMNEKYKALETQLKDIQDKQKADEEKRLKEQGDYKKLYEDLQAQLSNGYRDWETDRKSTRLNSSHSAKSRMPSSA